MAVFRPQNNNVCELNFDDKFTFTLPLHENTVNEIATIAKKQLEILQALSTEDSASIDKAYNSALDGIDAILGEGASEKIVTLFDNPGIVEVASVIMYISKEYSEQYEKMLNKYKATGTVPPDSSPNRGRR